MIVLDYALISFGAILIVAGVVGSLLPVIPGPPLSYGGLLLLQFSSKNPFSTTFLVTYALLTILVLILDYLIPIYGTKRLEGSKYGVRGSTAGMVLGLIFFFPIGIIIGPMIGAFSGEMISGKTTKQAFKSAIGSFLGFLAGASIKFILCISMAFYFITTLL